VPLRSHRPLQGFSAAAAMRLAISAPACPSAPRSRRLPRPSSEAVNAKARDLMAPVLGADKTDRLIAQINTLEHVATCARCARFSPC